MTDYKYFISLTEKESAGFADRVFNEIKDAEEIENALLNLALFTTGKCLTRHYPEMIKRKIFYPGEIYMHADENIAQQLIALIQKENSGLNINHLLVCLAWIGTNNVLDFLHWASIEMPNWAKGLHVSPAAYSELAGWVIDKNNKKRSLINPNVITLTKDDKLIDREKPFDTFIEHSEKCPFCNNHLIAVFEIPINSGSHNVQFTTCLLCSNYEPVFMKVGERGECKWWEKNIKSGISIPDIELVPIEQNVLKISTEQKKAEYTISQFIPLSKSQIGGFPTWIQDAEHLTCPLCKEKMQYVGQIDMEDVQDYSEGIYYFHYCDDCKITGTNYQQT